LLAVSENMFVHNNSKHGRRTKRNDPLSEDGPIPHSLGATTLQTPVSMTLAMATPKIKAIFPTESWCQGGGTAVLIGENFFDGLQAYFGSIRAWTELITPQALKVTIPPKNTSGTSEVSVFIPKIGGGGKMFGQSNSVRFVYSSLSEPSIEYAFQRLQKLLPKYPNDPERLSKEVILRRAADLAEMLYSRTTTDHLYNYASTYSATQFDPDLIAVTHQAPRSFAASYAGGSAAAIASLTPAGMYQPYASSGAPGATATFLNPPAGFTFNPFALQSLQ